MISLASVALAAQRATLPSRAAASDGRPPEHVINRPAGACWLVHVASGPAGDWALRRARASLRRARLSAEIWRAARLRDTEAPGQAVVVGLPRFDGQGWWLGQATCSMASSLVAVSNSSGVM
jgi:hypothetical protein